MARNLSALLHDAFQIYSEAYDKIRELGFEIAGMDGDARQPQKMAQLVYSTRLIRVIEPSLILNGGGTAIVGVVGEISTMNNLLLKLKRALKLYNVPAFPTPLTDIVINLGSGGGADADATYITAVAEGQLANSRRISPGTGISLTDNGPQGTMQINNTNAIDSVQVDTSVNPVLNLNGQIERFFRGSVAITGTRSWSLSNASNALRVQAQIAISGLTPGDATHDQTFGATFGSVSIFTLTGLIPSSNVFRPNNDGVYEVIGTTYDGVNWRLQIF